MASCLILSCVRSVQSWSKTLKWSLAQWSACEWSEPAVPGTPLAAFLPCPLLSSELWHNWFTHQQASLSVFCASKLFARSNWGDLLCGNIYHLLRKGSCGHDVSTLYLLNSDSWMSTEQGNCCHFNKKTAAFPTSVLQENMQVWSCNENPGLITKPHNTTQTAAVHLTIC